MEERVHPIPFRTRKLSSPSPMILHNVMWESRPLSTIAPKPLAAQSARGFVFSHLPSLRLHPFCLSFPSTMIPLFSSVFIPVPYGFVQSLSAAFTQNRLFRPECVSAGILMLTYLSTLRSKSRRFLFRPKNAYFANSPNTSHRLRFALASLRKATPRPAFDGDC